MTQVIKAGAEFLVRAPSNSPRLLNQDGGLVGRLELCRKAQANGFADEVVRIQDGKSKLDVAARVVVLPLPPEAAEKARRSARRLALKAQYKASDATLEMAGYLVLLTSLAKTTGRPNGWPRPTAYDGRWNWRSSVRRA